MSEAVNVTQAAELIQPDETMGTLALQPASTLPARRKPTAKYWPAAIKKACKIAFITGAATLAQLSIRHGIPYDTLCRWSSNEKWERAIASTQQAADSALTAKLSQYLLDEQERQIKRGVAVGAKAQDIGSALLSEAMPALDYMQVVAGLEKATGIVRRELGLGDNKSGSDAKSQFAISAGTVNVSL